MSDNPRCASCGHVELDQHETVSRVKISDREGWVTSVVEHLFIQLNKKNEELEQLKRQYDEVLRRASELRTLVYREITGK